MTKIAINGFGRIGRTFYRVAHELGLEIVAVNDLTDAPTLAHLFKYDSSYGKFEGMIEAGERFIKVDGQEVKVLNQKDPEKLPWRELGVEVVVESTGIFTDYSSASNHLEAGAKFVVITAPAKGDKPIKTLVMGVNENEFNPIYDKVVSMASCTTNALVPVVDVLNNAFGIEKSTMTTIHSYTMDQRLQDDAHKDLRRARAAGISMIPTTTGATEAACLVIPDLKNKMDGVSIRVPTATVSLIDFVALLKKKVTKEEINQAFVDAVGKYQGALAVTDEPLVSIDFKANPAASIVDLLSTQVVDGDLVKVLSWYDNELGYSIRLAEFIKYLSAQIV